MLEMEQSIIRHDIASRSDAPLRPVGVVFGRLDDKIRVVSAAKPRSKGWSILLAFIAAGALIYRFRPEPVPISPDAVRLPVLAVLIFDNLNEKPEMDFLANGLCRPDLPRPAGSNGVRLR